MKSFILFWYCLVALCQTATAEVVTDGSIGAINSLSGNMIIPQNLGTTGGSNLFHSFQTFNINSGESAIFTGSNNLTNVISRTTGGEISTINGLLKSEIGNAKFYFINPVGVINPPTTMMLQGGNNSYIQWAAPAIAGTYQVLVQIPANATATDARYRIYPKGNSATNTICSNTDVNYPCFEIAVNQALKKGTFVSLVAGTTQKWVFTKTGYVSVNASNLPTTEWLGIAGVTFKKVIVKPYSKIANDGSVLPDSAVLGSGTKDWACTRDNVTGLIWEVKTDDGSLRDKNNYYSWYDPNPATNDGFAGYQNYLPNSCTGGISCDTNSFIKAVNAAKLCSFNDWKMPSVDNLKTLVNMAYQPTINPTYFPNTVTSFFMSDSPSVFSNNYA